MESLVQDIKFGIASFRKSALFTITTIALLGLGIGASTAVFSLVETVLLKPLPYPEPDRIVIPWNVPPANLNLGEYFPWGPMQFHAMEQETKTFRYLGIFQSDTFNLSGPTEEPVMIEGMRVSYGFFPSLGVTPAIGRIFTQKEDQLGNEHVVLLSDNLWRDRFGSTPEIVGRVINLSGASYTIIGVMPPGFAFPHANEMPSIFAFPREAQLWVPAAIPAVTPPATPSELAAVGRLQEGVSISQAQASMDLFASRMDKVNPVAKGWFNSHIVPLQKQIAGDNQRPLLLMLSAVAGVLLTVCFNLASLLLIRSIGRQQEFSIRAALGAGRYRIVRQLFTESLLLSLAGGAVGLIICVGCIFMIKHFSPSMLPRLQEARYDLPIFGFAIAMTLLTSVIIGVAPAVGATRLNLVQSLKEGGQKAGIGPSHFPLRNALVVFQIALSLVLVAGCGLLVRTFSQLLSVDAGFLREHVTTFELSLPTTTYPDKQHIVQFYQQALPRLRTVAGVQSAAITEAIPMGGAPESTAIFIAGRLPASIQDVLMVNYTIVSSNCFAALGTPLERGRDLLDSDNESVEPVTVINQSMARRFWPKQDPIGQQVRVPAQRRPMTIVGVVADLKHSSLREDPTPEVFVPYTQDVWPSMAIMHVILRSRADPDAVIGGARSVLHSLDPRLPLAKVTTLSALTDSALSREKFSILLLGSFAVFSLVLAAIGIHGLISYSVSHRSREIGIRMALGASRRTIFTSTLTHGFLLTAVGIVLGVFAALAAGRTITSYLYGVKSYDPVTFISASAVLVFVALLAGLFPAYRAASIEPMRVLRTE
jgi:putative ABC transport system permease protein